MAGTSLRTAALYLKEKTGSALLLLRVWGVSPIEQGLRAVLFILPERPGEQGVDSASQKLLQKREARCQARRQAPTPRQG